MVRAAEEVLPLSGAITGTQVAPPTEDATICPPRECSEPTAPHADSGSEFSVSQPHDIDMGDDAGADARR